MFDDLHEECGVFGISMESDSQDIIKNLYLGLFALQHRGQETCGIAYYKDNAIKTLKCEGLVSGEFFEKLPLGDQSCAGIGHVLYPAGGNSGIKSAQPLFFHCNKGEMAIAHNGNIPLANKIKTDLIKSGSIFQTTSDAEILVHMMSRIQGEDFDTALVDSLAKIRGAYSMVILHDDEIVAFRDPNGFHPLSYAQIPGGIVFSSETNAFDLLKATNWIDIEPGEVVFCKRGKIVKKQRFADKGRVAQCVFELVYFARPDSVVFGESVQQARARMGAMLARRMKVKPDIVISVPDSGNSAAIGFANEAKIPFEMGLIRNHYTGRTFIKPKQELRMEAVRIKLNPVKAIINGKSVAVVDDSLVRGTTSMQIIKMLRDAGAKEVHLFLSSPEIHHCCFYGVDTGTLEELISTKKTPAEIAEFIGADTVNFLALEDLKACLAKPDEYCYACFDGDYPTEV